MKYKIIIFGLIVVFIIVSALAFLFGRKSTITKEAAIEFWGFEERNAWEAIIQAYQAQNKKISINYTQKDPVTYEKELLNALAAGTGPDIITIHNTWLNKHADKLSPLERSVMGPQDFQETYVDVALTDLVRDGRIYAVPFYVDTLALYYNKSMFNTAGFIGAPKTWDEFNQTVKTLTQKDAGANIIRAGAAWGTAANVNYAADILSLLMLQTGTVMMDEAGTRATFGEDVALEGRAYSPGLAAVDFYTGFADIERPVYTWNARMPNSLTAFLQARAAMYFGYSQDRETIAQAGLNFSVASLPQIKDAQVDPEYINVNFASYAAGAVAAASPNKDIAWNFLMFAASRNAANSYLTQTGRPAARKDLIEFQSQDPLRAVFAKQALSAFSWPQPDEAEVKKIFSRLIDSVALGEATSEVALKEAVIAVDNLVQK